MQEFYMRLVPLPPHVDATVLPNDDGTFDIYINASLSKEKQDAAFQHEVRHIQMDHFYNDDPVLYNEAEAEQLPMPARLEHPEKPDAPEGAQPQDDWTVQDLLPPAHRPATPEEFERVQRPFTCMLTL